ncbi:unnamed protein product [Heligmosomoides polygyrus]|uniref:Cadherin domain-containing protein n=1 Tax=Heligmosomoides polygyrus TaxID=6339 RepID=A0A183FB32_HELPZ|nr:unnamed protein product [Heligmosomoides polygyrus]
MAKGEVTSIRVRYSEEEGLPLRNLSIDGKEEFFVNSASSAGGELFDLPYSIESRILEITIASFKTEPCMKVSLHNTSYCRILQIHIASLNSSEWTMKVPFEHDLP